MKYCCRSKEIGINAARIGNLAWLALALLACSNGVLAQDYPSRSIRLVVPFAAGGGTDIVARAIAQRLNEAWSRPVVVENHPGGTGAVGTRLVAKASPDGHTLLTVTNSTHVIAPSLTSVRLFDPVKDFSAISLVATGPNVFVAHPSISVSSVKALVELAKAQPGRLTYASPGVGSSGHMAAELFKMVTGADIMHIPYKGAAGALSDLMAGHVQLYFSGPAAVIPHLRSNKIKALAVAYPRRTAGLEEVPTFIEAGYPEVEGEAWFGMLAPAGVPSVVMTKLNREILRITALAQIKKQFLNVGIEAAGSSAEQFAQLIENDFAKWQRVVKASGIRIE